MRAPIFAALLFHVLALDARATPPPGEPVQAPSKQIGVFVLEAKVTTLVQDTIGPLVDRLNPPPSGQPRELTFPKCTTERISVYGLPESSAKRNLGLMLALIDGLGIDLAISDTSLSFTCTRDKPGHVGWLPGNLGLSDRGLAFVRENGKHSDPDSTLKLAAKVPDPKGLIVASYGSFVPFEKIWLSAGIIPPETAVLRASLATPTSATPE
jgi:hypothetical protein